MEMAKKNPRGHNIGGSSKQKRRKEKKGKSQISAKKLDDQIKPVITIAERLCDEIENLG